MAKTWDFLDEIGVSKKDINRAFEDASRYRQNKRRNELEDELEDKFNTDVGIAFEDYYVGVIKSECEGMEGDRLTKLAYLCNRAVKLTEEGRVEEGHLLYMTKRYADDLVRKAGQMIDFESNVGGSKDYVMSSMVNRDYLQGYLNYSSVGVSGKQLADSTIENLKNTLIKINKLECISQGQIINYSSNIKTKADEKALDELAGSYNKTNSIDNVDKPHRTNTSDVFSNEDFNKIANPIIERLRNNPQKVTDPEVMLLLTGVFGIRKSTTEKLTISDLEPSKGWIHVESHKNKGRVPFIAKSGMEVTSESIEILQQVYKRALLRNSDKLTENGEVPLVSCSESYVYRKIRKILKDNGLSNKYAKDKFRALRNMYAQNCYDDAREIVGGRYDLLDRAEYDSKAKGELIGKAIAEVNYLMGHSDEHKDTTMGYIKNIY